MRGQALICASAVPLPTVSPEASRSLGTPASLSVKRGAGSAHFAEPTAGGGCAVFSAQPKQGLHLLPLWRYPSDTPCPHSRAACRPVLFICGQNSSLLRGALPGLLQGALPGLLGGWGLPGCEFLPRRARAATKGEERRRTQACPHEVTLHTQVNTSHCDQGTPSKSRWFAYFPANRPDTPLPRRPVTPAQWPPHWSLLLLI